VVLALLIGGLVGAALAYSPRYPVHDTLPLAPPPQAELYVPPVPDNQGVDNDQEAIPDQGVGKTEIKSTPSPAMPHTPSLVTPHAVRGDRVGQH
jgi:hypothetical protein